MPRWWQRLANGSILLGGGGLAFHAFHGPEHWLCLGAAGLLTFLGSVVSFLPSKKKARRRRCAGCATR